MNYLCSTIFVLSLLFVVYVLFGYPLLLALVARRRSNPIHKRLEIKTVSVLLVVYNGERWIRDKLRSILQLNYPRDLMQVLVISDGSTDRTEEIVREFAAEGVELLRVPRSGKASALNAGIQQARGEVLFFTDVRQPLNPECLKSLVSCLGDPTVGAACGQLLFLGSGGRLDPHIGLYWRYEKWIRANLTRLDSILAGTGCIYVLRRELAGPLPPDTLLDDSYLPLAAFLRGYRFVFDTGAIAYEYPTDLETEFHRKVRTLAGIYQLIGSCPALLGSPNRMRLHFVSYKLGRLLLPFALLMAAVTGFGLPGIWANLTLAAQVLFYGLAAADPWIGERWPVKRASTVIRTFVVFMAAALCAVSVFFLPARKLWKETQVGTPNPSLMQKKPWN